LAIDGGKSLLQALIGASGSIFAGALGAFVDMVLILFLLFFFLRDGEEMVERLLGLIPMGAERKARLVEHLAAVTRAVVFGALFTGLVQGTLVGIGFGIVRLPSPIVFGVLAAGSSLVPLVGTALICGPAAGVLAIQGRWGAAIFVVVWGAVVFSGSDNVVRPRLAGHVVALEVLHVLEVVTFPMVITARPHPFSPARRMAQDAF
jgi:predicted PurR-regulated permease PerM